VSEAQKLLVPESIAGRATAAAVMSAGTVLPASSWPDQRDLSTPDAVRTVLTSVMPAGDWAALSALGPSLQVVHLVVDLSGYPAATGVGCCCSRRR
jgi:hypothetical protein